MNNELKRRAESNGITLLKLLCARSAASNGSPFGGRGGQLTPRPIPKPDPLPVHGFEKATKRMFALGEPNPASPSMEGMQVWEGRYTKVSEWKQVVVADGRERHYEHKLVIGITGGPPAVLDFPPSETQKSVDPIPNRHSWRWVIGVVLALLIVTSIVTPVGIIVARNKRFEDSFH